MLFLTFEYRKQHKNKKRAIVKADLVKKSLLEALEKNLGVVTAACKQVGVNRATYYKYINSDPEFAAAVKDIDNITLDFAESQLYKQIKNGNITATIFFLKTKGKKRGYVERQEITGKDGQAINQTQKADYSKLSVKELEQLYRLIDKASTDD
jgi:hypothetical protein